MHNVDERDRSGTGINMQALIIEAALAESVDAVYHAATLYPLTAAVGTLDQTYVMIGDTLEAQRQWLPQFDLS
jgi:alpha-galactosidase/6-phospho-beta-glucosidase family protein